MYKIFYVFMIIIKLSFVLNSSIQKRSIIKDPCIVTVENNKINLNSFKKVDGYEVVYKDRIFLLNICNSTTRCAETAAVCEINTRTRIVSQILGYNDTLSVLTSYKPIPGIKYQTYGKKRIQTEIEFKCNRRIQEPNIYYVPPNGEVGRKYKFVFESNLLCIQQKMQCLITNIHDNSQYDIQSLYKENNNWKVENTTLKIYLNMCGQLNKIANFKNMDCSHHSTQVCLVDRRNISKNLGSFSSDFYIHDDMLTVIFKDGSPCGGLNYTETQIDLICSTTSQNPQLFSMTKCKYHIKWQTPTACPYHISIGKDCQFYSPFFGFRDMKTVNSNTEDIIKQIQNNGSIIRYNVCNSLLRPCGYYNNASLCLTKNGKDIALGWFNNEILVKNNKISINLKGETCSSGAQTSANIHFFCDRIYPKQQNIILSNNFCKIDINIYINLACPEMETHKFDCKTDVNDSIYNLEPLSNNNNNYEIADPYDSNIIYIINVCRPIIFNENSICNKYSAVCQRNNSEPNILKKYKSLGNIASSTKPILENKELTIRYEQGSLCDLQNVTHSSVFSEIQFICVGSTQESLPYLMFKDGCHFKFVWKTHYACSV